MTINVAILDDHRSFAEAISMAIGLQDDLTSVGIASSVNDFIEILKSERPDVMLVDYQLMGENGIQCAAKLREADPDARMILITAYASDDVAARALAHGYERVVGKEESVSKIIEAVRRPPSAASSANSGRVNFSRRQREVLELMGQGLGPATIADTLFISVHTARSHVKDVLRMLGVSTQLGAVAKAIRYGYLLPPSRHDVYP